MMMKNLLLIVSILFISLARSQDFNPDSCGIDDSPLLNQNELNYFQAAIHSSLEINKDDLKNKNILFLHGNYGANFVSKNEFFRKYCKEPKGQLFYPDLKVMILTEAEKKALKGYDVIIVVWSKVTVSRKNRHKFIVNGKQHLE